MREAGARIDSGCKVREAGAQIDSGCKVRDGTQDRLRLKGEGGWGTDRLRL